MEEKSRSRAGRLVVNNLRHPELGRRTGKNVVGDKIIRKDHRGRENFADYFTDESEVSALDSVDASLSFAKVPRLLRSCRSMTSSTVMLPDDSTREPQPMSPFSNNSSRVGSIVNASPLPPSSSPVTESKVQRRSETSVPSDKSPRLIKPVPKYGYVLPSSPLLITSPKSRLRKTPDNSATVYRSPKNADDNSEWESGQNGSLEVAITAANTEPSRISTTTPISSSHRKSASSLLKADQHASHCNSAEYASHRKSADSTSSLKADQHASHCKSASHRKSSDSTSPLKADQHASHHKSAESTSPMKADQHASHHKSAESASLLKAYEPISNRRSAQASNTLKADEHASYRKSVESSSALKADQHTSHKRATGSASKDKSARTIRNSSSRNSNCASSTPLKLHHEGLQDGSIYLGKELSPEKQVRTCSIKRRLSLLFTEKDVAATANASSKQDEAVSPFSAEEVADINKEFERDELPGKYRFNLLKFDTKEINKPVGQKIASACRCNKTINSEECIRPKRNKSKSSVANCILAKMSTSKVIVLRESSNTPHETANSSSAVNYKFPKKSLCTTDEKESTCLEETKAALPVAGNQSMLASNTAIPEKCTASQRNNSIDTDLNDNSSFESISTTNLKNDAEMEGIMAAVGLHTTVASKSTADNNDPREKKDTDVILDKTLKIGLVDFMSKQRRSGKTGSNYGDALQMVSAGEEMTSKRAANSNRPSSDSCARSYKSLEKQTKNTCNKRQLRDQLGKSTTGSFIRLSNAAVPAESDKSKPTKPTRKASTKKEMQKKGSKSRQNVEIFEDNDLPNEVENDPVNIIVSNEHESILSKSRKELLPNQQHSQDKANTSASSVCKRNCAVRKSEINVSEIGVYVAKSKNGLQASNHSHKRKSGSVKTVKCMLGKENDSISGNDRTNKKASSFRPIRNISTRISNGEKRPLQNRILGPTYCGGELSGDGLNTNRSLNVRVTPADATLETARPLTRKKQHERKKASSPVGNTDAWIQAENVSKENSNSSGDEESMCYERNPVTRKNRYRNKGGHNDSPNVSGHISQCAIDNSTSKINMAVHQSAAGHISRPTGTCGTPIARSSKKRNSDVLKSLMKSYKKRELTKKAKLYVPCNDENLPVRRSNRTRVAPLEYWRNERLKYKRQSMCYVIDGIIEPMLSEKLVERKEKKLKQRRANKCHVVKFPHEMMEVPTQPIPVYNPEVLDEVYVDCFGLKNTKSYYGADGNEENDSHTFIMCKTLQQRAFHAGEIILRPGACKPLQNTMSDTLVFKVDEGQLVVRIHETSGFLGTGDFFFVPSGNLYSLKNTNNAETKLTFFQIKGTTD